MTKTTTLNNRQKALYEYLVKCYELDENRFIDKREIAVAINNDDKKLYNEMYFINENENAHDICSLINSDRIKLNSSLEIEKIILVKDNKFKIATLSETVELENYLYENAMKLLNRNMMIRKKRIRNNQTYYNNYIKEEELNTYKTY